MGEQIHIPPESFILRQEPGLYVFSSLQEMGRQLMNQELSVVQTITFISQLDIPSMLYAQYVVGTWIQDATLEPLIKNTLHQWIKNIFLLGKVVVPLLEQNYYMEQGLLSFFSDNNKQYLLLEQSSELPDISITYV